MRATTILTVTLLAGGPIGCRSASPDLAPVSQDAAQPEAPAPKAPSGASTVDTAATELAPSPDDAAATQPDASEGPPDEDEPQSGPDQQQKEALELCQSAKELIAAGDMDQALSSLDRAYELMLALPGDGDDSYLQAKADIRRLVAKLIGDAYGAGRPARGRATSSWDLGMPIVDNEHVRREIASFTSVERELFVEAYRRSGRYRPLILARLQEAGLPSQLSWLPLVESWFKVRAYSRASAVGMWQFISSTGLRYGLGRDAWVDERFDPEKSTGAAIAYLGELHALFGDWPKALAAYNCGEARVERLQRRSADEYLDFWDLYELLPRETRRYVPRLFAALQIIEDPARYGMTLPEPDPAPGDIVSVTVERSVKLESLDSLLGLDAGTLAELNPELRYRGTPRHAYQLKVPAGREQALLSGIGNVAEWTPPQTRYVTHRVLRGETLGAIAGRYGTSVSSIMRVNGLRSANRIWPGQRLRIPVEGSAGVVRAAGPSDGGGRRSHADERRYTVGRGDTLGSIAASHHVSLHALLAANGLGTRATIYPGQELVIP
jgi:membrane-bound lytic murein transglycosylase D